MEQRREGQGALGLLGGLGGHSCQITTLQNVNAFMNSFLNVIISRRSCHWSFDSHNKKILLPARGLLYTLSQITTGFVNGTCDNRYGSRALFQPAANASGPGKLFFPRSMLVLLVLNNKVLTACQESSAISIPNSVSRKFRSLDKLGRSCSGAEAGAAEHRKARYRSAPA